MTAATLADASRIKALQEDLLGTDSRITLARVRARLSDPRVTTAIMTDPERYCEMRLFEEESYVKCELILPPTLRVSSVKAVVQAAAAECLARFPFAADWPTQGHCTGVPVKANGVDPGHRIALAWAARYTSSHVYQHVDSRWVCEVRLEELAGVAANR